MVLYANTTGKSNPILLEMGPGYLGGKFQSLELVQGRGLIFFLKYDRRDVFARSRIQMSGQNCRMELEVATNCRRPQS